MIVVGAKVRAVHAGMRSRKLTSRTRTTNKTATTLSSIRISQWADKTSFHHRRVFVRAAAAKSVIAIVVHHAASLRLGALLFSQGFDF
jgi:hypothetical protein